MLKIMTSREINASKMRYNTRIGTGKARHAQKIDTRTLWGRRDREIYNAIISDLGGADRLSELEHQVVRRAGGLRRAAPSPAHWRYPDRDRRGIRPFQSSRSLQRVPRKLQLIARRKTERRRAAKLKPSQKQRRETRLHE